MKLHNFKSIEINNLRDVYTQKGRWGVIDELEKNYTYYKITRRDAIAIADQLESDREDAQRFGFDW